MLKKILLIFILCLCAFCASLQSSLDNFDSNFLKSSRKQKLAFHQELKALYIKSVMDEDKLAKTEVLKRLIISSTLLELSDKPYEKELQSEGFSAKNIAAIKSALKLLQADINAKASKQSQAKLSTKDQDIKAIKDTKPKISKKVEEKSVLKENLLITKASKINQGLKLLLNRSLDKDELKKFVLRARQNYRSVIDIKGILAIPSNEYSFKGFSISLSQYDQSTIRLVLRSKKEEHYKLVLGDNSLQISLELPYFLQSYKRLENGVNLSFNHHPEPKISEFDREDIHYIIATLKGVMDFKQSKVKFKHLSIELKQFDKNTIKIIMKSTRNFALKKVEGENKLFLGFSMQPPKKEEPMQITSIKKTSQGASIGFEGSPAKIRKSSFKNKKNNYEILTFKAKLKVKKANFSYNNQEISIVQFNPKETRVVLKGAGNLNYYYQDGVLYLSFIKAAPLKKRTRSVTIDAGHGGKDSGAISSGKMEKNIVLPVALRLGKILAKRGFKVYYTRTKDVFINLRDRTKIANDNNSDLFISIHANALASKQRARKVHGIETFFLSPARSERSKEAAIKENQSDLDEMNYFSQETFLNFLNREKILASNKLAIDVQRQVLTQLRKHYSVNDGGVREAPFWVLVGAGMPAILIELGYITHPVERKLLFSKSYQNALATGIANGIESYFKKNP